MARLYLKCNDPWDLIPLEYADDFIEVLNDRLQSHHPLRAYKLFPVAKCWRRKRFLVEEEEPSDNLWVLDFEKRKKRVHGKNCYWYALIKTQAELDALLQSDHEEWVQYMKDAGAWVE